MSEPLHDHSEASVNLYALHNALLQALSDKRWGDAALISSQSVEWHLRLRAHLDGKHG